EVPAQPRLAQAAVRWADAVVTVSDFSQRLALSADADPTRLSVIHPGVTLPAAAPSPLDSRPGPPTILTVARLSEPHKGHDVALAAMESLRARVPDARWVMVGEGRLRDDLELEAQRRGLEGCVHFPGAVDDAELERLLAT